MTKKMAKSKKGKKKAVKKKKAKSANGSKSKKKMYKKSNQRKNKQSDAEDDPSSTRTGLIWPWIASITISGNQYFYLAPCSRVSNDF